MNTVCCETQEHKTSLQVTFALDKDIVQCKKEISKNQLSYSSSVIVHKKQNYERRENHLIRFLLQNEFPIAFFHIGL